MHIITESEADDSYALTSMEVDYEALASELSGDIRRNIDAWTRWLDYENLSDEKLTERKARLLSLAMKSWPFSSVGRAAGC